MITSAACLRELLALCSPSAAMTLALASLAASASAARLKFTLNIGFVEYSTESFSYICGRVLSLSCRVLNKAQFCDSVEYSTYLCSHIEQLSGL